MHVAPQDVVAKGQKFMIYKRPGQRVLISSQGYMLVCFGSRVSPAPQLDLHIDPTSVLTYSSAHRIGGRCDT